MLKSLTMTSVFLAATSQAAFAGGIADPVMTSAPTAPVAFTPAPVMASDWSGFYLGGSVGMGDVTVGDADAIDADNMGLHAGYNYDMGQFVLGAEVEYAQLDFENAGDGIDASVLRLKARAGYDAGAFLPYLTAGAAQLKIEDGSDVSDNGYFYGAGVEYAINDSFRVGGEILQHEFDDFNGGGADIAAQTMSLRVSYSF